MNVHNKQQQPFSQYLPWDTRKGTVLWNLQNHIDDYAILSNISQLWQIYICFILQFVIFLDVYNQCVCMCIPIFKISNV